MKISEVYRSVQGEGPFIGRSAVFLRLYGCNLKYSCSLNLGNRTGCDSKYTWEGDNYKEMTINDVGRELLGCVKENDLLVVTGGEPMLQEEELIKLKFTNGAWTKTGDWIVETNGTIIPKQDWSDYWSVSPHSLVRYQEWLKLEGVYFKFVCSGEEDFDYVEDIVEKEEISRDKVWVMPEGRNEHDLWMNRELVVEEALKRNYNYSDRLQIETWGNKRGV